MGWVVSATPRPLYTRQRPGTHCIEGWVGPNAGLAGAEYLDSTGIRSPDRPARSEPLYRLSTRWKGEYSTAILNSYSVCSARSLVTAPTEISGVPRGGLACSKPPRNSEDTGGDLDLTSKKNRRLDFLL